MIFQDQMYLTYKSMTITLEKSRKLKLEIGRIGIRNVHPKKARVLL